MMLYFRISHVLVWFYFSYFTVADDLDGICDVTPQIIKTRYSLDRVNARWIPETYKVPIGPHKTGCCEGYRNASAQEAQALRCEPICDPPCVKATCEAPDTCVCLDGHELSNGSNTTCFDVCDACVNSRCLAGGTECVCDPGYEKGAGQPHVCHPVCSPACKNGDCTRPGRCDCHSGYQKAQREGVVASNVCVPQCGTNGCQHGSCFTPNVCSCDRGYASDADSPFVCKPVCQPSCTDGFCASPNVCACPEGSEIHRTNRTLCVPIRSENSRSCEVNATRAIAYDPNTGCFTVVSSVETWWRDGYCTPVDGLLNECSRRGNDSKKVNCTLNFSCRAVEQPNSLFEVQCLFEAADFQVESEHGAFNGSQRRDLGLKLHAFTKQNRSTEHAGEPINVWSLRPLTSSPICGQMHFGVELSSTVITLTTTKTNTQEKDSNLQIWLPVLCVVITIVVGALYLFRKRLPGGKLLNVSNNAFDNPMYVDREMLADSSAAEADTNLRRITPITFSSPLQTRSDNDHDSDEGETIESNHYESIDEIGLIS